MFAPALATIRTVEVLQFCSWSACRMKNWLRARATSGSTVMFPSGTENIMCRKFSQYMVRRGYIMG